MKPEKVLGGVLRELRLKKKLSQEALALETGLERNYISLLELGQNSATIKTLFKLAPALGASVSQMLHQVEERLEATRVKAVRKANN